ncbi:MAG: outer membrane beta-barrel protein [Cellvibrionaceae bacterium]
MMINRFKLPLAFLIISGAAVSTAVADSEGYAIDLLIGEAGQKNSEDYSQTISGSDTSKGIRFTAQLNRVIGIEVGYTDFGEVSDGYINEFDEDVTDYVDSSALNIGMNARIPLGHTVSLVGRVGIASWDLDYKEKNSGFPGDDYKDSDEGVDGYIGVGLRFDLEENFRVGIEYTGLGYSASLGAANTDHIINNLAISAGFTF